jgi:hypothetical protein
MYNRTTSSKKYPYGNTYQSNASKSRCYADISRKEIDDYLKTYPETFIIYRLIDDDPDDTTLQRGHVVQSLVNEELFTLVVQNATYYNREKTRSYITSTQVLTTPDITYDTILDFFDLNMDIKPNQYSIFFDPKTTVDIYQSRKNCKTTEIYKQALNKFNKLMDVLTEPDYILLLELYLTFENDPSADPRYFGTYNEIDEYYNRNNKEYRNLTNNIYRELTSYS